MDSSPQVPPEAPSLPISSPFHFFIFSFIYLFIHLSYSVIPHNVIFRYISTPVCFHCRLRGTLGRVYCIVLSGLQLNLWYETELQRADAGRMFDTEPQSNAVFALGLTDHWCIHGINHYGSRGISNVTHNRFNVKN